MTDNPGINILELGQVNIYKDSYYSYYNYEISNLEIEYYKISNYRNEIILKLNSTESIKFRYKKETQTYVNILNFNIGRLENKINNLFSNNRNKRAVFNGLGTIIKSNTRNLDS